MLFLHASQKQAKIFFGKFDTEQETKQQLMAPLHTLFKAGGILRSSPRLQENTTAIVQLEALEGLFENAIDVCCDNSAQFNKFFHPRLLVVFSYYGLAESGQKNTSIYKNNNIMAGVTDTDDN